MATPKEIRDLAITMANEVGLINLTRQALCDRANIKDGSFPVIAGTTFTKLIEDIRSECKPSSLGLARSTRTRANPVLEKDRLINVALDCFEATDKTFSKVTRLDIAEAAGVPEASISHHFGSMIEFRRTIMRHAIIQKRLKIIAQGLAIGDAHARKAPQELKDQAVALLATA